MVPIKVGDYVEYSGVEFDGATIVFGMVVNVGITTSGNQPAFIRVEDALIGVADSSVDVEAARFRVSLLVSHHVALIDCSKFVGLASRSDLPVEIWAIDQDPCTGEESDRLLATGAVVPSARNKWEIRIPRGTDIGKYTRNYRVRIGDEVTTSDGIKAGQYVQPVTEWIFPELVTPGGTPPPNDFSNIGPLRDGFGPIDGTIFGQLSPWPGAQAPVPVKDTTNCPVVPDPGPDTPPDNTPVTLLASAGADKTVLSGTFVTLTAEQLTTGISTTDLTFAWTQIAGPAPNLVLTGENTAAISFAPPVVAAGAYVSREFKVLITHVPSGSTANDTVVVVSNRAASSLDVKAFDSLTWASRQSGTAAATAHTNLVDPAGSMRIQFGTGAEQPMVRSTVSGGVARYTYSARSTARFTSATIHSYINNVRVGTVAQGVTSSNVGAG
jgi:hypothetical protein